MSDKDLVNSVPPLTRDSSHAALAGQARGFSRFKLKKSWLLSQPMTDNMTQTKNYSLNRRLKVKSSWLLLLVWLVIGTVLRFIQLTGKSPWTDEFATIAFSLGNGFEGVPLDKAIALDVLMQPLQPNPAATLSDAIHHLLAEDHHPPVYFALAHLWMQMLLPYNVGVLWAARSLPALLGAASILGIYGLVKVAFRSRLAGHLAAAMMAVSPYGIFLAQEARHYTLAILWAIASLSCLIIGVRHLHNRKPLPIVLALTWVLVNVLGLSTHYFFALTLCAEALVLAAFVGHHIKEKWLAQKRSPSPTTQPVMPRAVWWRIYAVLAGTLAGGCVWLLVWQQTYKSEMTQWIQSDQRSFLEWINPIFQSLAAWITMISLLPVEVPSPLVIIASGGLMLIFFIWALPILYRGLLTQWQQPETRVSTGALGGFVLGAIALFFGISYGLGFDITRGARYNFVYFPAVIALLGASLAVCWTQVTEAENVSTIKKLSVNSGKKAVTIIWLMGLISAITVVSNLAYQKYYRPDILVPTMQQVSSVPVLIATTHNSLVQTGEIMGIGWEFQHTANSPTQLNPQFLLAHQYQQQCEGTACRASSILQQTLDRLPQPLDLWLVNFNAPIQLKTKNCLPDTRSFAPVYGYQYKVYHCRAS